MGLACHNILANWDPPPPYFLYGLVDSVWFWWFSKVVFHVVQFNIMSKRASDCIAMSTRGPCHRLLVGNNRGNIGTLASNFWVYMDDFDINNFLQSQMPTCRHTAAYFKLLTSLYIIIYKKTSNHHIFSLRLKVLKHWYQLQRKKLLELILIRCHAMMHACILLEEGVN